MKIIKSNIIPFHGYIAMAFFNIIIWRKEYEWMLNTERKNIVVNHESIHEAQMKDFCQWIPIGGIIFYICYFFEWLYKVVFKYSFDSTQAYRNLSYEKEAKENEKNMDYLLTRKRFAEFNKN